MAGDCRRFSTDHAVGARTNPGPGHTCSSHRQTNEAAKAVEALPDPPEDLLSEALCAWLPQLPLQSATVEPRSVRERRSYLPPPK